MARLIGLEGLTEDEIYREIDNGAKFVFFQYTISVIFMTFKRSSNIYFIRSDQSSFSKSYPYSLITLALGWWGFPWGPIYSIGSLFKNISGGEDITHDVLNSFKEDNFLADNPELLDAHM